jgi:prepilin-type N-terminal cleavage/methylation domain-containing protein
MQALPRHQGFTLVEIAVVLVIMGLMAALILPAIFQTIERSRLERGRDGIEALKNEVVGHVVTTKNLPVNLNNFSGRLDQWGRDVRYYQGVSGNICAATTTVVELNKDGQIITGIAFIIVSSGQNMNFETTPVPPPSLPATSYVVTYHARGIPVGGFESDDIIAYVSLNALKGRVCP